MAARKEEAEDVYGCTEKKKSYTEEEAKRRCKKKDQYEFLTYQHYEQERHRGFNQYVQVEEQNRQ